ncbi:MAG: NADH-quinone oxidoreductase subunit C [Candidatus Omnitrophica bacterium]|nr:NADH-quinone oxidoreductase subunit C [Candidatus Omnitrophota bacterium]MCM8816547.1 NADH-quinone oxidoreductase subunit C [Candidatus Omnitrophota bacterium]
MGTLEKIKERFGNKIKKIFMHNEKRAYIEIDKNHLLDFTEFIFSLPGVRFVTASGVDNLDNMEIIYHFSFDPEDLMVSIKTFIDRNNPEIESISNIIKGAQNIEREMYELLGIKFKNHPKLTRFLIDELPEGVYPLRKNAERQVEQ